MTMCDICGLAWASVRTLTYKGTPVLRACTDCVDDMETCAFCDARIHENDVHTTSSDDRVCLTCYTEFENALEGSDNHDER